MLPPSCITYLKLLGGGGTVKIPTESVFLTSFEVGFSSSQIMSEVERSKIGKNWKCLIDGFSEFKPSGLFSLQKTGS